MPEKPIRKKPADCSSDELEEFIRLVCLGGEVSEQTLRTNVPRAKSLSFRRNEGKLLGVAALKVPQASYREKFQERTGEQVSESDYPFELGYIYVCADARKKGYGTSLVTSCIDAAVGCGIFSTARESNEGIKSILIEAEFEKAGRSYPARDPREMISLFLRPKR